MYLTYTAVAQIEDGENYDKVDLDTDSNVKTWCSSFEVVEPIDYSNMRPLFALALKAAQSHRPDYSPDSVNIENIFWVD